MADGIQSFRDFVESLIRARDEDFAARPEAKVASPNISRRCASTCSVFMPASRRSTPFSSSAAVRSDLTFRSSSSRLFATAVLPLLRRAARRLSPPDAASSELPTGEPARQLHPEWKDRYGNAMWCPQGTIPMLRDHVGTGHAVQDAPGFFSKAPGGGQHPRFGGPRSAAKHKWANAYQNIANVGGASAIQICMPATT